VARTWIYLRRILDWYGEFNRVRTSIFEEHGLTGRQQAPPFPASTGIQGTRAGEECTMELLAAQGSTSEISFDEVADSARQNRAFAYGSAFSRAMGLRWQGADTILVSGTASIGTDGRTRHLEEPEAQLVETLMAIAALIAPKGCRLTDMASGTVYFKNDEARAAFDRVTRQLELPDLPLVPVRADVCRPELLVEIEAIILGPDDVHSESHRQQETRDVR
jgi:enamine deaminase RidA (YjgF/YER057c/UK114 family)